MRSKWLIPLFLAVVSIGCLSTTPKVLSIQDIAPQTVEIAFPFKSLVLISVKVGERSSIFGSGIIVDAIRGKGNELLYKVVTAKHLFSFLPVVKNDLVYINGQYHPYKVVLHKEKDLALVFFKSEEIFHIATLLKRDVRIGERAKAWAYPTGVKVLTEGIIGLVEKDRFIFTGGIAPGSSGGGVFVYEQGWKLAGTISAIRLSNIRGVFQAVWFLGIVTKIDRNFVEETGWEEVRTN